MEVFFRSRECLARFGTLYSPVKNLAPSHHSMAVLLSAAFGSFAAHAADPPVPAQQLLQQQDRERAAQDIGRKASGCWCLSARENKEIDHLA